MAPWTVACQVPLSMEFSRQEYWSGLPSPVYTYMGFPDDSVGKESACNAGDTGDVGSTPGSGRPLEKEMATPISILAWEIPQTE